MKNPSNSSKKTNSRQEISVKDVKDNLKVSSLHKAGKENPSKQSNIHSYHSRKSSSLISAHIQEHIMKSRFHTQQAPLLHPMRRKGYDPIKMPTVGLLYEHYSLENRNSPLNHYIQSKLANMPKTKKQVTLKMENECDSENSYKTFLEGKAQKSLATIPSIQTVAPSLYSLEISP